jgi:histone H3
LLLHSSSSLIINGKNKTDR